MSPAPGATRAGALSVLTGSALFGTIGTARVLGPEAPAASVGAVRLVLAATVLVLLAAPHGSQALSAAWRLPAVWVAGVAQACFNLAFLAAVTRAGVAVGTLVAIGCTPIITGLLARRITRGWLVATSIALVGLVALLSDGLGHGVTLVGVLLALGASTSYAVFILASTALTGSAIGTTPKLAAIFVVAAVILLPAGWLASTHWVLTPSGAGMTVYLALAGTVVAYSFFNHGLRTVESGTAATLGLTEPLVAAVLGVVVLGERLSALSWLGAFIVLVALVVMIRLSRPSAPLPAESVSAVM